MNGKNKRSGASRAARRADLRADFGGAEPGADGKPQLLVPGVAPIGDRQRLDQLARRALAGGNAPPPAGGLFDLEGRAQLDLLDKP